MSRVLNMLRVPASATIDGSWFQSLMDANIVHDQSGDAVKLARGLTRTMLWLRDLCMCLMFTASWGMAISPWSILWSMVSLCSFLRDASSFQPSSLRMPDTLTIPYTPFAHLAPCLWTLSRLFTSRLRTGSQIAPQYSIGDLTREVYAISLCLYGLPLRFLFTNPSLWWAFVDVCLTCVDHLRSFVSVIPRYFNSVWKVLLSSEHSETTSMSHRHAPTKSAS